MKKKKIKTLSLEISSKGTLGGTPSDVIVNGKYIGTIVYTDVDEMYGLTMGLLIKNGYDFNFYRVIELLGIENELREFYDALDENL